MWSSHHQQQSEYHPRLEVPTPNAGSFNSGFDAHHHEGPHTSSRKLFTASAAASPHLGGGVTADTPSPQTGGFPLPAQTAWPSEARFSNSNGNRYDDAALSAVVQGVALLGSGSTEGSWTHGGYSQPYTSDFETSGGYGGGLDLETALRVLVDVGGSSGTQISQADAAKFIASCASDGSAESRSRIVKIPNAVATLCYAVSSAAGQDEMTRVHALSALASLAVGAATRRQIAESPSAGRDFLLYICAWAEMPEREAGGQENLPAPTSTIDLATLLSRLVEDRNVRSILFTEERRESRGQLAVSVGSALSNILSRSAAKLTNFWRMQSSSSSSRFHVASSSNGSSNSRSSSARSIYAHSNNMSGVPHDFCIASNWSDSWFTVQEAAVSGLFHLASEKAVRENLISKVAIPSILAECVLNAIGIAPPPAESTDPHWRRDSAGFATSLPPSRDGGWNQTYSGRSETTMSKEGEVAAGQATQTFFPAPFVQSYQSSTTGLSGGMYLGSYQQQQQQQLLQQQQQQQQQQHQSLGAGFDHGSFGESVSAAKPSPLPLDHYVNSVTEWKSEESDGARNTSNNNSSSSLTSSSSRVIRIAHHAICALGRLSATSNPTHRSLLHDTPGILNAIVTVITGRLAPLAMQAVEYAVLALGRIAADSSDALRRRVLIGIPGLVGGLARLCNLPSVLGSRASSSVQEAALYALSQLSTDRACRRPLIEFNVAIAGGAARIIIASYQCEEKDPSQMKNRNSKGVVSAVTLVGRLSVFSSFRLEVLREKHLVPALLYFLRCMEGKSTVRKPSALALIRLAPEGYLDQLRQNRDIFEEMMRCETTRHTLTSPKIPESVAGKALFSPISGNSFASSISSSLRSPSSQLSSSQKIAAAALQLIAKGVKRNQTSSSRESAVMIDQHHHVTSASSHSYAASHHRSYGRLSPHASASPLSISDDMTPTLSTASSGASSPCLSSTDGLSDFDSDASGDEVLFQRSRF